MADAPAQRPVPRRAPPRLRRALPEIVRRAYALALMLVIVWLTSLAVRYLIDSLFRPSATPAQVVGLPTRLTESVLQRRWGAWSGIQAAEHARSPLAHYHRLEGWIQPDAYNDCTHSGCHRPLPHAQHKEHRAFLNLHATSLHCGVCHMQSPDTPLPLTWYDLGNGQAAGAPAALQAYDLVTSAEGRQRLAAATPADQARLAELLRAAAQQADNGRALQQLADRVAAVRPGGPAFATLVDAVRDTLPRHFRGEYGSKLALRDPQRGQPLFGHPGSARAVQDYLAAVQSGKTLADDERRRLLDAVHTARRLQPRQCTDCHRSAGSLIDFAAAGYPEARRAALSRPESLQLIEALEHTTTTQPLHLPQFIAPRTEPSGAPQTPPHHP